MPVVYARRRAGAQPHSAHLALDGVVALAGAAWRPPGAAAFKAAHPLPSQCPVLGLMEWLGSRQALQAPSPEQSEQRGSSHRWQRPRTRDREPHSWQNTALVSAL